MEHRRRDVERPEMRAEVGGEHALEAGRGHVRRGLLHLRDGPRMERRLGALLEEVGRELPREGPEVPGDGSPHLGCTIRRGARVLRVVETPRGGAPETEGADALAEPPGQLEGGGPAPGPADGRCKEVAGISRTGRRMVSRT